jgi:hypothetical protein
LWEKVSPKATDEGCSSGVRRWRSLEHPSSVSALRADPPSPTRGEGKGAASPLVDHRLDVVAIGVEHEAGVVVRCIIRTRPRRAIVRRVRIERRPVERIDLRLALRPEGDMQMGERRRLAGALDLEQATIADIESQKVPSLPKARL